MELVVRKTLGAIIGEYEAKKDNLQNVLDTFEQAGTSLKTESCVSGRYGNTHIDTGRVYVENLQACLLKSAWFHTYDILKINEVATAEDKQKFSQGMENPPEFTIDNIKATFGDYIMNPMANILRGLAEVFCSLDQSYKSHEKVKIGVKGLPKRIILSRLSGMCYGYGSDKLRDVLNALAQYQGKPLIDHNELSTFVEDGESLRESRGVWLKLFKNGNGHLFFDDKARTDINKALGEYYGDVLPDCYEDKPTERAESTEVSKDLQYYPTAVKIVDRIIDDIYIDPEDKILEPSCGCGRIMDGLKKAGATNVLGIEFDSERANICREKGHNVLVANFLETVPTGDYDKVIMNPPFYGKHYAKHVNHALKFLKDGGILIAILPATARYDHGLIEGEWRDLPVGSFSESGTNINTSVVKIYKGGRYGRR